MSTKVSFAERDEILGAIIRALAVQVAGFQVAGGMNGEYLKQNGFFLFKFSPNQLERFKRLLQDYVPDRFQQSVQVD